MKNYSSIISLTRNSRGVYCLDTSMGCSSGMVTPGGCYNDCYAAKTAKIYGYDFSKTILRNFKDRFHKEQVVNRISKIKLSFVRIGCSGDPSENWEHCMQILKVIQYANKEIIIITRHWKLLSDEQLLFLSSLNICINTSVSALDSSEMINKSLKQYERIKPYCKSVLRIISCDFNENMLEGKQRAEIQRNLFKHKETLDTVFRPGKENKFVAENIINTGTGTFNGSKQLMSKYSKKTFTGSCNNCFQMCGVNIKTDITHSNKPGIIEQLSLFKNKKY